MLKLGKCRARLRRQVNPFILVQNSTTRSKKVFSHNYVTLQTARMSMSVQLACLSSSRVSLANRSFYRRNSRTNLSVFLSHRSVLSQGFIPSKKQGKTLICKSRLSIPDALAADCYLVDKMNSYGRSKTKPGGGIDNVRKKKLFSKLCCVYTDRNR